MIKGDVRPRFPKLPKLPGLPDLPKLPSGLLSYKAWDAMLQDWEKSLPGGGAHPGRKLPMMLITAAVVTVVCLLELGNVRWLRTLENMTYDGRVRLANRIAGGHPNMATNLGLVVITDDTVDIVSGGTLGYSAGLLWPRSIYARALAGAFAARSRDGGL